jgi:hypothetical protein
MASNFATPRCCALPATSTHSSGWVEGRRRVPHSSTPPTRETERRHLTWVNDVALKGGLWRRVERSCLSIFSVRQRGQCGRCGEHPIQSKQIKIPRTYTLNDKGVVWHRRAGQAVEALGRLNSGRKESRPCVSYVDIRARMATEIVVRCWQARAMNQEEHGHEGRDAQRSKL